MVRILLFGVYANHKQNTVPLETMKMKKENKYQRISGIVFPVSWDEKGKVVNTGISTSTEEGYLVRNDAKGKELLNFILETVDVSGLVIESKGIKKIKVKHIMNWKSRCS